MTEIYTLPDNWTQDDLAAMRAWVVANHIVPSSVPIDARIAVTDDQIVLEEHELDTAGCQFLRDGEVAKHRCTYPLLSPLEASWRERFAEGEQTP